MTKHADEWSPCVEGSTPYRGEVIYIFAFDLAYDMQHEVVPELFGREIQRYSLAPSKRSPKYLMFHQFQRVVLPDQTREVFGRNVTVHTIVKLFDVGAISIQIRMPFEVSTIEKLSQYHDVVFDTGPLQDEAKRLAEQARAELAPFFVSPVVRLMDEEAYTVFCFRDTPGGPSEELQARDWLRSHRRSVAAVLAQEDDPSLLSDQEVNESTAQYVSYYKNDLIVVDWDAAIILGETDSLDDVLHVMELANVQLVELSAYDRLLDAALETSYRDIGRWTAPTRRKVHRNLREIRVDLARLSDELLNITKFFGDWHLAKVYNKLSARFRLADWHKVVDEKLATLAELYSMIQQDWINLWMIILEATIVILFIIDVILMLASE